MGHGVRGLTGFPQDERKQSSQGIERGQQRQMKVVSESEEVTEASTETYEHWGQALMLGPRAQIPGCAGLVANQSASWFSWPCPTVHELPVKLRALRRGGQSKLHIFSSAFFVFSVISCLAPTASAPPGPHPSGPRTGQADYESSLRAHTAGAATQLGKPSGSSRTDLPFLHSMGYSPATFPRA